MKRIVSIALALIMMLACASTVFATEYVKSPTGSQSTLTLVSDTARIKLTPYADRDTLSAEKKALIEKAYSAIPGIPASKGVAAELFDLSLIGEKDAGQTIQVTLKGDSIKKFAAFMHFNGTAWEEVAATASGDELTAALSDFSPYLILVSAGSSSSDKPTSPQTNDTSVYFLTAAAVLAFGAVAFLAVSKKKSFEK